MEEQNLQGKETMIPQYIANPKQWLGMKKYTNKDLLAVKYRLGEVQAAIKAIEAYRSTNKKPQ